MKGADNLVKIVLATVPDLNRQIVADALAHAAPLPRQLRQLEAHLAGEPDAITSGDSAAPPPLVRLIEALRLHGAEAAALPRCGRCEAEKRLPYRDADRRICAACYARTNADICSRCQRTRPVATRGDDGSAICDACYRSDPSRHETCVRCVRPRPVAFRDAGGPQCQSCYDRPTAICGVCGRDEYVHSRTTGIEVCRRCYQQPPAQCFACGRVAPLAVRESEQGGVCHGCYQRPIRECDGCGRERPASLRTEDGWLCVSCAPRPVHECVGCGRVRPAQALTDAGAVCSTCYNELVRRDCAICGRSCRPYEAGACADCILQLRIDDLLAGTRVRQGMSELRRVLTESDDAKSAIRWVQRSAGGTILGNLLATESVIEHETLDRLDQTKALHYVRDLLMAADVLPRRARYASRMDRWIDEVLRDMAPPISNLVRQFATWRVTRRLRRRTGDGDITAASAKWARLRIRQATVLLRWLEDAGVGLANLDQSMIDSYLTGGATTRYAVRDFVVWAQERGLVAEEIEVPLRQVRDPMRIVDDENRWGLAEVFLHDDAVPLDLRVAGALVTIYGQHLSRVVALRTKDVHQTDEGTAITFGADPVVMVEGLDGIVRRLVADHRGHASIGASSNADWLFPGGGPGRHVTAENLRRRLAAYDLELRPTRNTALLQLAAELPSPILADLLNMHPNTAVAWSAVASGQWGAFMQPLGASMADTV